MNDNELGAVMGATTTIKTLVDGTFRVQIDISPLDAQDAFKLFGTPGTPVALARVTPAAAQRQASKEFTPPAERGKGGSICKLAAIFCGDTEFHDFLKSTLRWAGNDFTSIDAAQIVRDTCHITSRAELDSNPDAAAIFHRDFRLPYQRWLQGARA